MFGDRKQVWVFNKERKQWVTIYFRSFSQLWKGDQLLFPALSPPEEKTMVSASGRKGKPETHPVVLQIPGRIEVRKWLVDPPNPPFTIAIAESGKKHILYRAQEALDRAFFPVQFELDSLYIDHSYFLELLNAFELLMGFGFTKTEIKSGVYRNDRAIANQKNYEKIDSKLKSERSRCKPSRLLQLVSFVGEDSRH